MKKTFPSLFLPNQLFPLDDVTKDTTGRLKQSI